MMRSPSNGALRTLSASESSPGKNTVHGNGILENPSNAGFSESVGLTSERLRFTWNPTGDG